VISRFIPVAVFFSVALLVIDMGGTSMLAALHVPIEALGLIMAIDPILDMFRTMSNTTGDIVASLISLIHIFLEWSFPLIFLQLLFAMLYSLY